LFFHVVWCGENFILLFLIKTNKNCFVRANIRMYAKMPESKNGFFTTLANLVHNFVRPALATT
jgi:hypothetical protein